jgi:hypothetical protein
MVYPFKLYLLISRRLDAAGAWEGKMNRTVAVAALAILAGCAAKPETIAPAYVSTIPYETWTCAQLASEAQHIEGAMTSAYAQQNQARTNDAVGVFFIGLPVSSMSGGNIAPQIATLKGQQEAVRQTMQKKGCASAAPAAKAPVG